MKVILFLFIFILNFYYICCYMTDQQLKATAKLIRNVCQPKFKVADDQIEAMHKGNWEPMEHNAMCYLWCILNMQKLITKDNVFLWEDGVAQLKAQAPDSIRDAGVASVTKCKDALKTTSDKCIASYEVLHCVYTSDPEHYFLP